MEVDSFGGCDYAVDRVYSEAVGYADGSGYESLVVTTTA